MSSALQVVALVLVVLLATLLACVHTAVTRINRVKAHHLLDQDKTGARTLVRIVENPQPYRSALAFVLVLALVSATVLSVKFFDREIEDGGAALALAVATIVLFLAAVVVPNALSGRRLERVGLAMAGPTLVLERTFRPIRLVFTRLFRPLRRRGDAASSEDADETTDGDTSDDESIEEEERELIHSVFEFGDTVVREVMVPRTDMVVVAADASLGDALDTITRAGYSRIPIYEGDTDNIVGVLYAKDLLKRSAAREESTPVGNLGRDPLFVPEQKKVSDLLREMQQERVHMGIVVDEYGGTAGLVTIEDLIEEIVGEIVDEYDQEEPLVEPLEDDSIRVSARLPIDEVNELLDVDLPHEEWDTVGGLVFGLTGRVPRPGEKINYDSLEFQTERVSGRRIQKVVIRKRAEAAEPAAE